ncbi:hypothetical protein OESDEN_23511, partial [Oesophagostomum dentatum]
LKPSPFRETDWETNPRYRDGAEWDKLKRRNAELILESLERSSSWEEFETLQIIQAVESGCRSDDSAEARIEDGQHIPGSRGKRVDVPHDNAEVQKAFGKLPPRLNTCRKLITCLTTRAEQQ